MIIKRWNSMSLILRICIGLVIGAILGLLVPGASWIAILGTLFVGALKAIAPILVFVLVASSLLQMPKAAAWPNSGPSFSYTYSVLSVRR